MHNQHAGLSQILAAQRITERHQQATQARLAHGTDRPRQRRWQLAPGWWRLGHWPGITQPAVRHPAAPIEERSR